MISFQQDSLWGGYRRSSRPAWVDSSGNRHPRADTCAARCIPANATAPGPDQAFRFAAGCPGDCWRYGFPLLHNPLFSFVRTESPALSVAFQVVAGPVAQLLVLRPGPGSVVFQADVALGDLVDGAGMLLPSGEAAVAVSSFRLLCGAQAS